MMPDKKEILAVIQAFNSAFGSVGFDPYGKDRDAPYLKDLVEVTEFLIEKRCNNKKSLYKMGCEYFTCCIKAHKKVNLLKLKHPKKIFYYIATDYSKSAYGTYLGKFGSYFNDEWRKDGKKYQEYLIGLSASKMLNELFWEINRTQLEKIGYTFEGFLKEINSKEVWKEDLYTTDYSFLKGCMDGVGEL